MEELFRRHRDFEVLPRRVGGGTLFCVDLAQPPDEQGLREAVRNRRSLRIRGDDASDGEAVGVLFEVFRQFLSAAR